MLDYIEKIVDPDSKEESYVIGYLGVDYAYEAGDALNKMLMAFKIHMESVIARNNGNIARLELEGANNKARRTLVTPLITGYEKKNKEIASELELLDEFQEYLTSLDGEVIDSNNRFLEENYDQKVGLARRLRMNLGGKPTTAKELVVYRGILNKKIKKAELEKEKYENRRMLAYPYYTMAAPGKHIPLTEREVSYVYNGKLEALEENIAWAEDLVDKRDEALASEWELVSKKLDFIEPIATYASKPLGRDTTKRALYDLRRKVVELDMSFDRLLDESTSAHLTLGNAEKAFKRFKKREHQNRMDIIKNIMKYNDHINIEREIDEEIAKLREKGISYTRTYRAK